MLYHLLSAVGLLKAMLMTAITAAANNSAVIDCLGYERAVVIFHSKPSGSGTTSDCKLQDGDQSDGSDAADITSATFTQVTTAGGEKAQFMEVNLAKRKRYLRAVHTGAGGSAAGQASVEIILYRPRYAGVSQDLTVISI